MSRQLARRNKRVPVVFNLPPRNVFALKDQVEMAEDEKMALSSQQPTHGAPRCPGCAAHSFLLLLGAVLEDGDADENPTGEDWMGLQE